MNVHLKPLKSLRWITLAWEVMKNAVNFKKNEVRILCQLLTQHKANLSINLESKDQELLNPTPVKKNAAPVAFKDSPRTVSLSL